jgi:hypothetical protein
MSEKIILFLVSLFLVIVLLSSTSLAQFAVGVSPGILDLGDVEPGSSKVIGFDVVTSSEEKLLVRMEAMRGNLDFFNRDEYKKLASNYSEEDSSTWVEFLKNPIELVPIGELKTKAGVIKGWRRVDFILNVPENSEPGYHTVMIRPIPIATAMTGGQVATQVVAVTALTVLFKTPGNAIREGKILDVVSGDYDGDNLEVNVLFQNTGTVTMQARAARIDIFDKDGKLIVTLSSGFDYVKPGETKTFKAYLNTMNLPLGDYNVSTVVSYGTGSVTKEATINVYEKPKPLAGKPVEVTHFPWVLIIVVFIIIAYIVYRRIR